MSIGDVIANERRRRLISVQLVVLMKCKTIETVHKGQKPFFTLGQILAFISFY